MRLPMCVARFRSLSRAAAATYPLDCARSVALQVHMGWRTCAQLFRVARKMRYLVRCFDARAEDTAIDDAAPIFH